MNPRAKLALNTVLSLLAVGLGAFAVMKFTDFFLPNSSGYATVLLYAATLVAFALIYRAQYREQARTGRSIEDIAQQARRDFHGPAIYVLACLLSLLLVFGAATLLWDAYMHGYYDDLLPLLAILLGPAFVIWLAGFALWRFLRRRAARQ